MHDNQFLDKERQPGDDKGNDPPSDSTPKALALLVQRTEALFPAPGVRSQRRPRIGLVLLLVLGVFFLWAAFVPLSKGVVAPGTVVVDSQRKTIQHLEGGVVHAIHVKEGARVQAGAVLVELDDTQARANRDTLRWRYFSKLAALDALQSLLEGRPDLVFRAELLQVAKETEVAEALRLQQGMFKVLRLEHEGKTRIAQQRIEQLEQKLQGLQAYRDTLRKQVAMLTEETRRLTGLQQKRLVEATLVAERMQQLSQQQGELGNVTSSIAETRIAIGESRLNLLQVAREWHQELAKQLSEAQETLLELKSQLQAAQNVLDRTIIRAPIAGVVLGMKVTTIGGVVTTGSPLMDVVPEGDTLVIDAHVRPVDVDSVHRGMKTHVKFTSFKARSSPDVFAVVDNVSADVLTDPDRREPYYLMRVAISGEELRKLGSVDVVPGMPVEVYADGGSRTLLQYLFDPVSTVVRKSLRED
ncbi:HlyD family type I secretion periplasmic adaptor subunit [Candidatus Symbiobacter mobilis]|uniref:Membrane fusion protein (MFP) family protein n=1 Tax=Candidatus Symbiobacter mobilis CR TaxID=946483 RepID=U5N5Z4_9BURK|nr:HlyD family type I secretion periplasmic adaptor subunit [Candidatus Symbiobacter mobilis]AGX86787.1 membrane protein [Candidatus Symbiobacter mobilis CR]